MKSEFWTVSVLILVIGHVSGNPLEDLKAASMEKIESNMNNIKQLTNETLMSLPLREGNLKVIAKHVRDTGNQLFENAFFHIYKTAMTGLMARSLMRRNESVDTCIKYREQEAYKEADRYYAQKFKLPIDQLEAQADAVQSQDVNKWIEEYNTAVHQFSDVYHRTVSGVQAAREEDTVRLLMYDFERNSREMEAVVVRVNLYLDKLQLQFLQISDNKILNNRNAMRARVDSTVRLVNECFGDQVIRSEFDSSERFDLSGSGTTTEKPVELED